MNTNYRGIEAKDFAHNLRHLFLIFAFGFISIQSTLAQSPVNLPAQNVIIANLNPIHPRLLIGVGGFAALKSRITQDTLLQKGYAIQKREADSLLTQLPSERVIGRSLLDISRQVLRRIYNLALVYRMEGDAKYAERAIKELEAVEKFSDWNPGHFLDVAELVHAFAIGYDWLFDYLSSDQRKILRDSLITHGFNPALEGYKNRDNWTNSDGNWNIVCNSGLAMGALAIGDEEPTLSKSIFYKAMTSLATSGSIEQFGPDGGWGEGTMYWGYAMDYLSTLLDALHTALGTDFGISAIPGVDNAGFFPLYTTGPSNRCFNFADAHEGSPGGLSMFWLASRFNQPAFAESQKFSGTARELIWHTQGKTPIEEKLPLDRYFRNVQVFCMRSAWEDANAVSVGFKGGKNTFGHSHLDLGSLVMDAFKVRWIGMLGPDDYELPDYSDFKAGRWQYYRLRAEGSNTFLLNPGLGPEQNPEDSALITTWYSHVDGAAAVADMSAAYSTQAETVKRGVALFHNRQWVMIQDEAKTIKPAEAWWFLHTETDLSLSPDSMTATFKSGKKHLVAKLLSPAKAKFQIMTPTPLPTSPNPRGQDPNIGWSKLAVHLSGITNTRLTVVLVPLDSGAGAPTDWPSVEPLSDTWPAEANSNLNRQRSLGFKALSERCELTGNRLRMHVDPCEFNGLHAHRVDGQASAEFHSKGNVAEVDLSPGLWIISWHNREGERISRLVSIL